MRVSVIDLRSLNGPYRIRAGETVTIKVNIERLNLVEGEYKVGLFVAYGAVSGDFPELAALEVTPATRPGGLTPYPAPHRGFVELETSAPQLSMI